MKINGNQVTTRHERPTVLGPTALLLYFINDGQYTDPHFNQWCVYLRCLG